MKPHLLIFPLSLLSLSVAGNFAHAEILTLSPKTVAQKILSDSNQAKETQWTFELGWLDVLKAQSRYEWALSAESGYELDQMDNLTHTAHPRDQTYTTKFALKKPTPTGTTLGLDYTRTSIKSDFAVGSTPTYPDTQTQDILGVSLEQNLLRNFFGTADRSTVKAAELNHESNQVTRADQLQILVLDGIRLFWKSFVAQENFKESVASRDRYEKLVEVVRRKNSLGYANPGELPQIQAEFESRVQSVKQASVIYLAAMDDLTTLLKLPKSAEIKFDVPEETPALPALKPAKVTDLRAIQAVDLKIKSLDESIDASKSFGYPDLSLIAQWGSSGLDESASEAQSQVWSSNHPRYYIGLRFLATFGSGVTSEDVRNKRLQKQIQESTRDRLINERSDDISNAQRKLQANYSIAQSMKKQRELREKAAVELQKSYTQGRTDISVLIDALNKYFASEVSYSQAVGDYQIALNEWAALKDELVTSAAAKEEKK